MFSPEVASKEEARFELEYILYLKIIFSKVNSLSNKKCSPVKNNGRTLWKFSICMTRINLLNNIFPFFVWAIKQKITKVLLCFLILEKIKKHCALVHSADLVYMCPLFLKLSSVLKLTYKDFSSDQNFSNSRVDENF